jgi:hypothetical protein
MPTSEAIGISLALGAIAVSGLWLIFLPFRRIYSSPWFRQVAVSCGIAGLLSTAGHALLLLQPHRFDHVRHFEVQTISMVLGGVWLGLLISLFCSSELWGSRSMSIDNPRREET